MLYCVINLFPGCQVPLLVCAGDDGSIQLFNFQISNGEQRTLQSGGWSSLPSFDVGLEGPEDRTRICHHFWDIGGSRMLWFYHRNTGFALLLNQITGQACHRLGAYYRWCIVVPDKRAITECDDSGTYDIPTLSDINGVQTPIYLAKDTNNNIVISTDSIYEIPEVPRSIYILHVWKNPY